MTDGPRILSLLPAATECLAALGFADDMVGRSHACDFPGGIDGLPVCTQPKIDTTANSADIDRQVRDLLAQGLSVYGVDTAQIRSLAPDLIVTQTQCEACAVTPEDLQEALDGWLGRPVQVMSLAPYRLSDVWQDFVRLGTVLGMRELGEAVADQLSDRVAAVAARTAGLSPPPTVVCLEWLDPLIAAGHWVPELVAAGGGRDVLGTIGGKAPRLEWDALRALDPDIILVMPCGFDLSRTRAELPALTGRRGWQELRAVQTRRVFLVDGNRAFSRPGPRLTACAEMVAEMLYADVITYGHEGRSWVRA